MERILTIGLLQHAPRLLEMREQEPTALASAEAELPRPARSAALMAAVLPQRPTAQVELAALRVWESLRDSLSVTRRVPASELSTEQLEPRRPVAYRSSGRLPSSDAQDPGAAQGAWWPARVRKCG